MTPGDFTEKYYPFAKETQDKTGISAIVILAQAALESGWGEHAPGNAFFGVKDTDGVNGNEQLITTTEISRRSDLQFPVIISMVPTTINGQKYFKYTVKDYFRKYDTPEECFTDHTNFFLKNERYAQALAVKSDPDKFADAIATAGYATAPGYAILLKKIISMISLHKPY